LSSALPAEEGAGPAARPDRKPATGPSGTAFLLDGGARAGVLLVHGFTGSPYEMRALGESLAGHEVRVLCPRLPGHGEAPPGEESDWPAWLQAVDQAFASLVDALPGRPLIAIGLSMGALLALDLAVRRSGEVRAIAALSPAITLPWPARSALWLVRRSSALRARYATLTKGDSDIRDPVARAAHPRSEPFPLASVLSFAELQVRTRPLVPSVKQPILIVHARRDRTCPLSGAAWLARSVGSRDVEMHVLERSAHVVTVDLEADLVERLVAAFVERTCFRPQAAGQSLAR